jgi:hypothetical protein
MSVIHTNHAGMSYKRVLYDRAPGLCNCCYELRLRFASVFIVNLKLTCFFPVIKLN